VHLCASVGEVIIRISYEAEYLFPQVIHMCAWYGEYFCFGQKTWGRRRLALMQASRLRSQEGSDFDMTLGICPSLPQVNPLRVLPLNR
jgi:hypothetical protein